MEKVWNAKWISDSRFASLEPLDMLHKETLPVHPEHPPELRNQHFLFRKRFHLDVCDQAAQLFITADDYYKLYVNGRFVAQGPAQGYPSHYYYNQIDVSEYIHPGANVIAVHVYYQGLMNRALNSGDLRQGLMAELYIGDHNVIVTDKSWKYVVTEEYGQGETIGYDTQYLEHIDSRRTFNGWRQHGHDDVHWLTPVVRQVKDYHFVLQPTPPRLCIYCAKDQGVVRNCGR